MKINKSTGFAFVYFDNEQDAADAIRGLDNMPFGYDRRKLSIKWAKVGRGRHGDGCSKILGCVVSVEYALKDVGERDDRFYSPRRRNHGRHRDSPYRRSPSRFFNSRPSPNYDRAHNPVYDRYSSGPSNQRCSTPDYSRNRSPEYGLYRWCVMI
ncbi:hypothetical protein MLD38_039061 [Melastoma candidum]|uniref:Uncharacterized protein n=1 Tax=Melastoma candidum TaxID=119954 RepID=A0ACB9L1N3_9MYRT|nr:hypothetical protein MLD38_039061 [Melastoma candidum]